MSRKIIDVKKMQKRNLKIFMVILLIPLLYVSFCLSGMFKMTLDSKQLQNQITYCLTHPKFCYNSKTMPIVSFVFLLWILFALNEYIKISRNLMHGREFGEAKWGDIKAFNLKYASKEEIQNKILSENVRFRYDSSTLRNNNMFIAGGSGAGKTGFMLTPNLLSFHDSNIYTDPKGTLIEELGECLQAQPDRNVYQINLIDMSKSMKINPFLYIRKKLDLMKLITNLIQNTNSEATKAASVDPYWERSEKMLLESLFTYVWLECPTHTFDEDGNDLLLSKDMSSVLHLIDELLLKNGEKGSRYDHRMETLRKLKGNNHPAIRAYDKYHNVPDDTLRSVLSTIFGRMQPFDDPDLVNIFTGNDIPFDEIGIGKNGDGKTKSSLFIIIPDDDDTFNFVPGMVYTLLFQELYFQARLFDGKLPLDVGFWFDEFANIKMPNNFPRILSTCRSRGIYIAMFLQSLAQMKKLFADGEWEGVVGNCDTFLYLGGNEQGTYEYIVKLLGKWTIDKKTNGESKGHNGSSSENYDVLGRELLTESEVRLLPNDECIMFIRGEKPIRDKKWFPWEHEEYQMAKDYGEYKPIYRKDNTECIVLDEEAFSYQKKLADKTSSIHITRIAALDFMNMDFDELAKATYINPNRKEIEPDLIEHMEREYQKQQEAKRVQELEQFNKDFVHLSLLDIYSSSYLSTTRMEVIKDLLSHGADENVIKNIIHPKNSDQEVLLKVSAYKSMYKI